MMSGYKSDRRFTDWVHRTIALPKIYKKLGWKEVSKNYQNLEELDINKGIDRIFITKDNKTVTVQERFRIKKYREYNDFTIRYTRNKNRHRDRRLSEFFKIETDYFVYGITDCENKSLNNCSDFIKFAVIDMRKIKDMIKKGDIIIGEKSQSRKAEIENSKLKVPILKNRDGSSEFIAIPIDYLCKLNPNSVILQKGFCKDEY